MKPGWIVAHDRDPRNAMPYLLLARSVRSVASWIRLSNVSAGRMPRRSNSVLL
jgi:hypothetical protein